MMTESQTDANEPNWRRCLPADAEHVHDISNQAVWTLSSCKVDGYGIQQLLDDRVDLYWQSDGAQPHSITIEFQRKTDISFLAIYLDHKADESYTPSKVQVQAGNSILDLEEPKLYNFTEPTGWMPIDLRNEGRPVRAFVLLLQVLVNHQNGRDTHIRGLKVIGPTKSQSLDVNKRVLARDEKLLKRWKRDGDATPHRPNLRPIIPTIR